MKSVSDFRLSPQFAKRAVLMGLVIPSLVWMAVSTAVSAEAISHGPAAAAKARQAPDQDRSHRSSRAIAAVDARLDRCSDAADGNAADLVTCDTQAIDAFNALLRRSRNKGFAAFLNRLEDTLFEFLTKGDASASMQVVASGSLRDLARKRAIILTGADTRLPHARGGRASLNQLFDKLPDVPVLSEVHVSRRLRLEWVKVRNADCAAHRVPHCAERLDAALADVLDGVLNDK